MRVMEPSGSTTVRERTLSRIVPYRTAHVPDALQQRAVHSSTPVRMLLSAALHTCRGPAAAQ